MLHLVLVVLLILFVLAFIAERYPNSNVPPLYAALIGALLLILDTLLIVGAVHA